MAIDQNKHQRRVGMRGDQSRYGWKVPALLGVLLVLGAIVYMTSDGRVTTAANDPNRPAVTQPAPAPTPSTNPNPTR